MKFPQSWFKSEAMWLMITTFAPLAILAIVILVYMVRLVVRWLSQ